VLGAAGGAQSVTLAQGNLPNDGEWRWHRHLEFRNRDLNTSCGDRNFWFNYSPERSDRHSGRKYSRRLWQWQYGRQCHRSDTCSRRVRSDTHPRLQRSGAFSHDFRHGQRLCIARRQRHSGKQYAAGDNGKFHHSRSVGLTTLSLSPSRSAQLHTA
jgi:hypothetical protein